MGSGQWVQNELHPFNCNSVPGGQANYYIIGPSDASFGAPPGAGAGGGEPPASGGGYLQLEANTVHASIPDTGVTSGYATTTPATCLVSGGISVVTNKTGHSDPPLTTGSTELHDWSSWNPSGYGFPVDELLQTHRQKCTNGTNNAGASLIAGLTTPTAVTSAVTFRTITSMPSTTATVYAGFINASNHQIQMIIKTDANLFANAQSRYYNGSTWTTGTLRQRQSGNLVNTYIPLDVTFDPASSSINTRWALDPVWNNLNQYPDYPSGWPGWESFGAVTSVNASIWVGSGTVYNYALRVEFA